MKKSGIYRILNRIDGKFYIGSAFDFNRRFSRHKRLLNNNYHTNSHLQNAWNFSGECNFIFEILEEVIDKSILLNREQFWLDWTQCYDRDIGYNILKIADNRTGILHSKETKIKMSMAHKGKVKSKEWQDKITKAITGKKRNLSVGKAHSERMKGFKHSDETKEKMRFSQTGRKHSEESKRKRSEKLKGKLIRPLELSL